MGGTFIKDYEALRYGGKIGEKIFYKVYGQHFDRNPTQKADGTDFTDAWRGTRAGFKMDWNLNDADSYTIQGDYYAGTIKTAGKNSDFNTQNVLARWNLTFSEKSDMTLQVYYDRYFKADGPGLTSDKINTGDVDFQYRFPIASRHNIVTGIGYRLVQDEFVSTTPAVDILPGKKNLDLFNAFIQDEITVTERFKITAGTKVLHNVYTGFEVQPGVRMALMVTKNNTLWAAISRAVRTPSRLDVNYYSAATPRLPTDYTSEKVYAFELGYRIQPNSNSSFSIATFYNEYRDLFNLELIPSASIYQNQNGSKAKSWGAELSGTYQLTKGWRLRGGYTYFDKKLEPKSANTFQLSYLSNDVKNQAMLHSMTDISRHFHADVIARYLDYLPKTIVTGIVPGYFTFDARIAYTLKAFELSIVGQNLYEKKHSEFASLTIPRSVYAKLTLRL